MRDTIASVVLFVMFFVLLVGIPTSQGVYCGFLWKLCLYFTQ